jgi:hypothetical protein
MITVRALHVTPLLQLSDHVLKKEKIVCDNHCPAPNSKSLTSKLPDNQDDWKTL